MLLHFSYCVNLFGLACWRQTINDHDKGKLFTTAATNNETEEEEKLSL